MVLNLGLAFGICGTISYLSYKFRFLSFSGVLAAIFIGTVTLGLGGLNWGIVLLWFFFSSSLLSQIDKKRKATFKDIFEKSETRDGIQVLANGLVASILVICHQISPAPIWYFLFLATLASVTADTWGTEIGILSEGTSRLILNFKKVPAGTSGGISFWGTLASLLGSLSIASLGVITPFNPYKIKTLSLLFISLAGFLASLIDSFLGATVQSHYVCLVCNKITERKNHCNQKSNYKAGLKFINNDGVNFLGSTFGLLFGYIFFRNENFS